MYDLGILPTMQMCWLPDGISRHAFASVDMMMEFRAISYYER